jgi:hypothetical protein
MSKLRAQEKLKAKEKFLDPSGFRPSSPPKRLYAAVPSSLLLQLLRAPFPLPPSLPPSPFPWNSVFLSQVAMLSCAGLLCGALLTHVAHSFSRACAGLCAEPGLVPTTDCSPSAGHWDPTPAPRRIVYRRSLRHR